MNETSTISGAQSGFLPSLFGFIPTAANLGLSFLQESNRQTQALRTIDAQRDIALAQYGAAVPGRVQFPFLQQAQTAPLQGRSGLPAISFGSVGGALGGYAPLILGGALLLLLVRR